MKSKLLTILLILMLTIIPAVSAADDNIALTEGTHSSGDTTVELVQGKVSFETSALKATAYTDIDGVRFVPANTKSIGDSLVWESGEKQYFIFDDPTVAMAHQYDGKRLKETITLKADKQLSFPVSLNDDSKLIPWEGSWKIVSATSGDTMRGVVIEKPYGIDATGKRIGMEYEYVNGSLNLVYDRTITTHHFVGLVDTPTYSEITYPLVIDPTWTAVGDRWDTTDGAYTISMWNTTGTTTFTIPVGVSQIEYLVVAGGGQGGYSISGGGGAGGVRQNSPTKNFGVSGTLTVTVGAGGTGGTHQGASGGNSLIKYGAGVTEGTDLITGHGGAGGGESWLTGTLNDGATGGSGGGGGMRNAWCWTAYGGLGTTTTGEIEGKAGGDTTQYGGTGDYSSGGGGGQSAAGGNGAGNANTPGAGGAGYTSVITGENLLVAGGGGGFSAGGARATVSHGGGTGGGNGIAGAAGTVNTGGGGGAAMQGAAGYDGGSGIVIIKYQAVTVPIASFASSNISVATNSTTQGWAGRAPFTMQFTNTSTGAQASSWVWNATNTTGNNVPFTFNETAFYNPIHTFIDGGNYSIKLNVTNSYGTNISTQTTWVNVTTYAPVASFTPLGTTTGITPVTVQFNDTSTYDPTAWNWTYKELAGVETIFSSARNVSQVFTNQGNYSVYLNASSYYGFNKSIQVSWVNVTDPIAPTAGFSANTTTPYVFANVAFTDETLDIPTSWLWNFGNGLTSTLQNANTSYGAPGLYTVSLTASNAMGSNITTKVNYINATYDPSYINANFTAGQTTGQPGTVITFVDLSAYGVTTGLIYNWSFGDPFSTAPYSNLIGNTQHVYNNGGVYDVNLTISNTAGSSTMVRHQYITISTSEQKLNLLYYHETRINVVDTKGAPINGLNVTIQMVSSTTDGTNWLTTLFGTSGTATPVEGTMVTGFTDSNGAVVFTSIGSGLYQLHFLDTTRGIDTIKTLHPSASDYTFVIPTTASAAIPSIGDYISGNLTVTPIGSNVYLNMSYNDTSSKTTNVNYFIVFPNQTTFYTKNFAGTPTTNQSVVFAHPVANVRGDAYVWGYTAISTQWGLVNRSQGITMKGIDGILYNPFVHKDEW